MRNIILSLLIALATPVSSLGIIFDLRQGKAGFEVVKIAGIEVHISPEVATKINESPLLKKKIITNAHRVFTQTKNVMPNTYSKFIEKEYKVYFLNEPHASNGLEYIRAGQEKWDRRIPRNGSMSKSIMIFRTFRFFDPPFDTFYFVHEMAHFNHIAMNEHRDIEIRNYYDLAVKKNKKFLGLYGSKNHMEYFAEISAVYLVPGPLVARRGMPKGAEALKSYSPWSYKMAERFWGSKKTNFKPEKEIPPKVDDIPIPEINFATRRDKHQETPESVMAIARINMLVRQGMHYEELSRHGWTLEGPATTTRKKSFEAYFKARNKLIEFESQFPNHNVNHIKVKVSQKLRMLK
tara:strand:+ start:17489 stop:18538 length:1050 start_codon:yes stop_codon:yes gene_type:complete